MESHKKLLGILHIVYGGLTILIFLIVNLIFSSFLPFILSEIQAEEGAETAAFVEMAVGVVKTIIFVTLLLFPLPSIIGGIGLLNKKNWGITWLMVSGCLSLLSFPLGTALGIYTIWVFLEDRDKKRLNDKNSA